MTQVMLHKPPVADFRAHGRFEKPIGASPFHFRAIQRRIRVTEKRLTIRRVVRTYRDADAGRNERVAAGAFVLGP